MTAAINDAPIDDLDVEDEVFTPERIRSYEDAQLARDHRLYRVFARHRETRRLGRSDRRWRWTASARSWPSSTTPRWCVRTAATGWDCCSSWTCCAGSPRPSRRSSRSTPGTRESNDHMVGVNETLGYRVMGRGLEFQKKI